MSGSKISKKSRKFNHCLTTKHRGSETFQRNLAIRKPPCPQVALRTQHLGRPDSHGLEDASACHHSMTLYQVLISQPIIGGAAISVASWSSRSTTGLLLMMRDVICRVPTPLARAPKWTLPNMFRASNKLYKGLCATKDRALGHVWRYDEVSLPMCCILPCCPRRSSMECVSGSTFSRRSSLPGLIIGHSAYWCSWLGAEFQSCP